MWIRSTLVRTSDDRKKTARRASETSIDCRSQSMLRSARDAHAGAAAASSSRDADCSTLEGIEIAIGWLVPDDDEAAEICSMPESIVAVIDPPPSSGNILISSPPQRR